MKAIKKFIVLTGLLLIVLSISQVIGADTTPPTVSVDYPTEGSRQYGYMFGKTFLQDSVYIDGNAYDAESGVRNIAVVIKRVSDGKYYDGTSWVQKVTGVMVYGSGCISLPLAFGNPTAMTCSSPPSEPPVVGNKFYSYTLQVYEPDPFGTSYQFVSDDFEVTAVAWDAANQVTISQSVNFHYVTDYWLPETGITCDSKDCVGIYGTYAGSTKVELICNDPVLSGDSRVTPNGADIRDGWSGCDTTYYSINGAAYEKYYGPFLIFSIGNNTILRYSTDFANNKEVKRSMIISITEPPKLCKFYAGKDACNSDVRCSWCPECSSSGSITDTRYADVAIVGASQGGSLGFSVSSARDFTVGGYGAVIVGAPYTGPNYKGQALIFGGGLIMDNMSDITITGPSGYNYLGFSVSSAGDFNGDGYDDVIVGSLHSNVVWIYYGGPNRDNIPDVTIPSPASSIQFGSKVSSAGNVNKDGYDDVLIKTEYSQTYGPSKVYLYYGSSSGYMESGVVFSDSNLKYYGGDFLYGDMNKDGYSDILIGTASQFDINNVQIRGKVEVYYGSQNMDNILDTKIECESWTQDSLGGTSINDFGDDISSGDFNGDGYLDVVISAPQAFHYLRSGTYEYKGAAFIYYGPLTKNIPRLPDVILYESFGSNFGFGGTVSSAGDVNKDGYDDVLVAGEYSFSGVSSNVYLFYGGPSMHTTPDVTFNGEPGVSHLGYRLSAGDVNKDQYSDIILGAPFSSDSKNYGQAYVFNGPFEFKCVDNQSANGQEVCTTPGDEDGNGECDYDNTLQCSHGDVACPVGIVGLPVVSNSNPLLYSDVQVNCGSTVSGVSSISAMIVEDLTLCTPQPGWTGNSISFSCKPLKTGQKTIRCFVDESKSYNSAASTETKINVIYSECDRYSSETNCTGNQLCEWCPMCNGVKSNGLGGDKCVDKGTCYGDYYSCHTNEACGAKCDFGTGGCTSPTPFCNLNTCSCSATASVCVGNVPNGICDAGESCGCTDCFGKVDSCLSGNICYPNTDSCGCAFGLKRCADGSCSISCTTPACTVNTDCPIGADCVDGVCGCSDSKDLCSDGTCSSDCGGGDYADCIGGAPNKVCEVGESCHCSDCDGQQASCTPSGSCVNQFCSECVLSNARWDVSNCGIVEGSEICVAGSDVDVGLNASGTSVCAGRVFDFRITFKDDAGLQASVPGVFADDYVTGSWKSVWVNTNLFSWLGLKNDPVYGFSVVHSGVSVGSNNFLRVCQNDGDCDGVVTDQCPNTQYGNGVDGVGCDPEQANCMSYIDCTDVEWEECNSANQKTRSICKGSDPNPLTCCNDPATCACTFKAGMPDSCKDNDKLSGWIPTARECLVEKEFPFFSTVSIIFVLVILAGYYFFVQTKKRKAKKKK